MEKIFFSNLYFNIKDSLECGQLFRFIEHQNGYLVYSFDKCAFVYSDGERTVIECDKKDKDYFYNYFDLDNDYSLIYNHAQNEQEEIIKISSEKGKGIRIFNQNKFECIVSFIISQNNNIPRIKSIIEKLCKALGQKRNFNNHEYYAFPNVEELSKATLDFYKEIGLGYRAEYLYNFVSLIKQGLNLEEMTSLTTDKLRENLIKIKGIGPKVADCITLFAYHKSDSFPVDTWIEKVYNENFSGKIKDRKQISKYFVSRFQGYAGYIQQYLFYYKRSIEKNSKKPKKN